ncbi:hypothetical protein [Alkalihalobacillus sp. LMS39]|uniref:hypothetical protein n=1 Tax=Alkalihalobacillus sp. LMS39 TaxID=2924032 RepID=UPI001FB4E4F1|nr:hypothetical protein [Alkalihalobacillus sp. LMS39]UOE95321.1 hypothetical protein MM271_06800 [Alkalihalobacillus sp. LMS39]
MIFIFLSLMLIPKQSYALECPEDSPLDMAFDEYDAVIIGKVIRIDEKSANKTLTIQVEKSYKGVDKDLVIVEEDLTWGTSQLNSEYVYFLNKKGQEWVHHLCSPTTKRSGTAEKFLTDKEEIELQNVVIYKYSNKAFFLIIFCLVIALFFRHKKTKDNK